MYSPLLTLVGREGRVFLYPLTDLLVIFEAYPLPRLLLLWGDWETFIEGMITDVAREISL